MKTILILLSLFSNSSFAVYDYGYSCQATFNSEVTIYLLHDEEQVRANVRGYGWLKSEFEKPVKYEKTDKSLKIKFIGDVSYYGRDNAEMEFIVKTTKPISEVIAAGEDFTAEINFTNDQYFGDRDFLSVDCQKNSGSR